MSTRNWQAPHDSLPPAPTGDDSYYLLKPASGTYHIYRTGHGPICHVSGIDYRSARKYDLSIVDLEDIDICKRCRVVERKRVESIARGNTPYQGCYICGGRTWGSRFPKDRLLCRYHKNQI